MAASPAQDTWKQTRGPSREVRSSSPESSLTWCLYHLSKTCSAAEDQRNETVDTETGGGKEVDKKTKVAQWRALVAIRTQHIKGGCVGIARFRTQGGHKPLLNLLKHPECSKKTLDLALSILANCCTELETRVEVRKLDGITVVVDILKRNVATETIQNRAARALGNLAMDPENSALIHTAGGVPLLLLCLSLSSSPSSPTDTPAKAPCPKLLCAQSATRALQYLSDTPSNRLLLLTQGTLTALAPLIAPEHPDGLRRAALRTIHELTRGCSIQCAREVSRSGVVAQLGVMASGESDSPFEELALKTLANMCSQGCLRPLMGSLGVIQKFTEEVKRDPLSKSGIFLRALCLCCKEAVNRYKVTESGGLEALIVFLARHQNHPLSRLAISACADFIYDESALEQMQELGLVPLLISRLVEFAKGEEPSSEKIDGNPTSNMSPSELLSPSCFECFDFPTEVNRREDQGPGSSSFLSLRSWLVSEGLITSEGDLLESPSGVEGDWGSLQIQPSASPQTSSTNPDSLKSPCQSPSFNPKHIQPSPQPLPSSSSKSPALSASTPQPDSILSSQSSSTPSLQIQLSPPSSLSSPTKTPQTPISPSKFSSSHKKRPRVHTPARLLFALETPPSAPRPPSTYYNPYHPEPWAPESPILLLLSRFSHATDPSTSLINSGTVSGLLFYLTRHKDPSVRCFRMMCRLSCNPLCLEALVRTGSVALIRHYLCQREELPGRWEKQTKRVKAKVKQLGVALLNNLRVQCESGFGSGVLAHMILSGSESDKMICALSLPLVSSNKAFLKKLLLDHGGLRLALQPLGCDEEDEEDKAVDCGLSDCFSSPHLAPASQPHSLYCSLLIGCLSNLMGGLKTELDSRQPRTLGSVKALSDGATGRCSSPPLKKPRLDRFCPYQDSTFDLFFLLDDGTQVSANRNVLAGMDGTDAVASEYFRALLKGGFGEAQGSTGAVIPIKDVNRGMLLPVLHYLHGCRLATDTENTKEQDGETGVRGRCEVLGSLALEGPGICPEVTEEHLMEEQTFQSTPIGEMMIGACRFLVTELQREAEDLCISLLRSCFTKSASGAAMVSTEGNRESGACNMDPECLEGESADESLANRTSSLELSVIEPEPEYSSGQMEKPGNPASDSPHQTDRKQPPAPGPHTKINRALKSSADVTPITSVRLVTKSSRMSIMNKSLTPQALRLSPKNSLKTSRQVLDPAAQDSPCSTKASDGSCWAPQAYWFSQQYSFPGLGKACLLLLLGCQGSPQPFPHTSAGDCLRRLAREADCTETLKRDILNLATIALT